MIRVAVIIIRISNPTITRSRNINITSNIKPLILSKSNNILIVHSITILHIIVSVLSRVMLVVRVLVLRAGTA